MDSRKSENFKNDPVKRNRRAASDSGSDSDSQADADDDSLPSINSDDDEDGSLSDLGGDDGDDIDAAEGDAELDEDGDDDEDEDLDAEEAEEGDDDGDGLDDSSFINADTADSEPEPEPEPDHSAPPKLANGKPTPSVPKRPDQNQPAPPPRGEKRPRTADASDSSSRTNSSKPSASASASEKDWSLPKPKRPRTSSNNDDDLAAYEETPRVSDSWTRNTPTTLPIKTTDGKIVFRPVEAVKRNVDEGKGEGQGGAVQVQEGKDDDVHVERAEGAGDDRKGVAASVPYDVVALKEYITGVAEKVIGDPENNIPSIKPLLKVLSTPTPRPDTRLPFILTALLAIFADIIPGYRIRARTETEKGGRQMVSKDVRKLWTFEEALLDGYVMFLEACERVLKDYLSLPSPPPAKTALAKLANHALRTLLLQHSHFNYRTNIISTLVKCITHPLFTAPTLETLSAMFHADRTGQTTIEIVRILGALVKARKLNSPPGVVKILAEVPLQERRNRADQQPTHGKHGGPGQNKQGPKRMSKEKQNHMTRRAQKLRKLSKEVDEQLKEAEASVDAEERQNLQKQTLEIVFATYIRLLKEWTATEGQAGQSLRAKNVVSEVLSGIGKLARYVSLDFLPDVLVLVRRTATDTMKLWFVPTGHTSAAPTTTSESGQRDLTMIKVSVDAALAAMQLLRGSSDTLNIDLAEYASILFAAITALEVEPNRRDKEVQDQLFFCLLSALDLMFAGRDHSSARPAAFAKRLLSCSLSWRDFNHVQAVISFVQDLLMKYPQTQQLLDPSAKHGGNAYRPFVDDPELVNPFSSSLFEVSVLMQSVSPNVVKDTSSGFRAILDHKNKVTKFSKGHWRAFLNLKAKRSLEPLVKQKQTLRPFPATKMEMEESSLPDSSLLCFWTDVKGV
ncbi:NOC3p-domain-containing protein [Gonapodya prolifera JEL478]|uniref:NOC3p-domain-containing protein n=1 Tax=Gonapodya prolifera (strain JEL478) TaxID=1344416 RepID=A0A139A9G7_GONPJ|nr:NOC3p-domain-containing protein [Gonapodya prolifera JEL478]|eukprot:KXS13115.1 NOC3p-domain-containing protein [Gonapodya prolifera JEL478]